MPMERLIAPHTRTVMAIGLNAMPILFLLQFRLAHDRAPFLKLVDADKLEETSSRLKSKG
jgi:hypothetical protein